MTSRLKKIIYRILGKPTRFEREATNRLLEEERKRLEKRRTLEEKGIVFLSDRKIRTPEGLTFLLQGDVYEGTDISVVEEIFCRPDYDFRNNGEEKTIVIDMGMNVGIASLFFAARKNVSAVYSFEPFTPTYRRALENIELNPDVAGKIKTFNIGLGKENKTLEIPYCGEFSGDMSTTIDRLEHDEKYHDKARVLEKVEIKNAADALLPIFDSLTAECVVLKIDTEGAEDDILESLDSAALLNQVDFIMMEFHFKHPQSLEDILTKNGFIVICRHYYHEAYQVGLMYAANLRKRHQNGCS